MTWEGVDKLNKEEVVVCLVREVVDLKDVKTPVGLVREVVSSVRGAAGHKEELTAIWSISPE